MTAIEFDSDRVIDLLVERGCNMYAKTKTGECVLDVAIMGGRLDLFHCFVKAGINAMQLLPVNQSENQICVSLLSRWNSGNSPIFAKSGDEWKQRSGSIS